MAETETDPTVLGKRVRDGEDVPNAPEENTEMEEDDDDDIGPMPMPAGSGASKKKRKGAAPTRRWLVWT